MLRAVVLGQEGIEKYSLSPKIHNTFFRENNMNGNYTAIAVKPKDLKNKLRELQNEGFTGVNLTIPHKINAMEFVNELDETAKKIGAINTILFKNGKVKGFNTDAFGFIENINKTLPNWKNPNIKPIIFGAGGASHAAIYGLQKEGITDIAICNRTDEKANNLAEKFNCQYVPWGERNEALKSRNFIINTTSGGMVGYPHLDVDLTNVPQDSIVYDIVYNPENTPLLKQAKDLNLQLVYGFGMLTYQAAKAFEIWFGIYPKYYN